MSGPVGVGAYRNNIACGGSGRERPGRDECSGPALTSVDVIIHDPGDRFAMSETALMAEIAQSNSILAAEGARTARCLSGTFRPAG